MFLLQVIEYIHS